MKFEDIPAEIINIRVKTTDATVAKLEEQPVMSVSVCPARPGEFEIRLKNSVIDIKPIVDADIRRLGNELASGRAMLAQLANPAIDGSIELQCAFFTGECLEMNGIDIGVDEYVEQAVAKIARQKLTGKKLYETLERHCCLVHGDQPFFFLTAGPAIDAALKSESEEKSEEKPQESSDVEETEESDRDTSQPILDVSSSPKAKSARKNSFLVTGDDIRFIATKTPLPDGKSVFIAKGLRENRNARDRALRLAKGTLKFVDWTQAGQPQTLAKQQLSELSKDDGSYLKKWDKFGDLEGELLLKHAREIGALQYCKMNPNRDGTVSVPITQASDSAWNALAANGVEEVEVVDDLPDYLKNPNLKFADFASGIEKQPKVEDFFGNRKKERKEKKTYFKVSDYDAATKSLTIKTENLPPSGTLILSLAGEIAQIKRRMSARKAILEGCSANQQLGLLIEEKGKLMPTRPPHEIKPLTGFVRNKVFRNQPTEYQEKAIKVALNTPDIALIQGPPGTGKTTVIAAILERLNEMADKRGENIRGAVLLTGFQHYAVENMIARLSLNSIPVPKFGKRSGADEDDFNGFEKELEKWCDKIAKELRAKNPQIAEIEKETEIKNLCLQYIKVPTRTLAANLAKRIADLGITILGEEPSRRAANLARKLSLEENLNAESNSLLDAVRRLRIRPESFADDGPERATDALVDLKDVLEESERDLLDQASLWRNEDGIPPFLNDLVALKKKLLIRFTAPPVFRVEKQNDEIIALAEVAIKRIKVAGFSAKDAKSAALAEFLAELESNPYGMIDAVSDYSFAFAATCQHSGSESQIKRMQKYKGITEYNPAEPFEKPEYEFVIVDEAARVSPRDLMIPMAQGKRIILVGDHRQLPHIVDEDVIKELSEKDEDELLAKELEVEGDDKKWSSISLFEHLFINRLPILEKQDGFCRRVTLDKQFRMHPLLGDFISRNFYERFDPLEKFRSGKQESDFAHNLPDTENKPAIWLDVPAAKGKHQRSGTSWTRRAEAVAIARQLQAWMNSAEGENLSFGVISFYRAQAELIKKQLGKITDDDGKLRIGTVDSFQGMEFDVVFLSMVRTMRQDWKPRTDEAEEQARSLFGHLCLYNRLNVSMSRQKKLLVVAGDSGLIKGALAAQFIPGLVDFFNLCRTKGRVLTCR